MIITLSSSSDGWSPLWLKNKKFLRKTLSRPKGSGVFSGKFCSFFDKKIWEFFCFSNVNLTSFAIFWEILTKFSISQNWKKQNPAQWPSIAKILPQKKKKKKKKDLLTLVQLKLLPKGIETRPFKAIFYFPQSSLV